MATWLEIGSEMDALGPNGPDVVRRRKLAELSSLTGRPVILYAVDMFNRQKIAACNGDIAIDLSDKSGFTEALRGITGEELDVIIHTPGGSPEATESIVEMLRSRFKNIRFIIPNVAKSAGTMLAMSGEEIILGEDAELGPIDPQMVLSGKMNPAHAIIRQFDSAKKELAGNSGNIPAWLPILEQYGPSLLIQCQDAQELTKKLVNNWLKKYMFKGDRNGAKKAKEISSFLASKRHLSHGRAIPLSELKKKGVKVVRASECAPYLSELIGDIDIALIQTFSRTGCYKMFENHQGKGLYRVLQTQVIQMPPPMQVGAPPQP